MAKYIVTYDQEVVITYEALVEADSKEEALELIGEGSYISEEEIDWQGIRILINRVELLEEVE